ncbi:MAG: VWA domain-containing protein [Polyangiaceae bacterium]|nr:VWA domain-containing protein [Polyangiaceae bacterium]
MSADTETITQGTLRTSSGQPLPLERTAVKATIGGPVASVEVRQVFRNNTGGPIEAVYLFPLPHEASVYRMSFTIGSRTVNAVVKEKEEAKRAYERARSEGRSATLLEQERPNLFTLSVANVPDGETIEVSLGYQEKLGFDDGEWRFVFPMVAAERYHPGAPAAGAPKKGGAIGTTEVPDAARIRPPRKASGERAGNVEVEIEINAGREIEPPRSPSHRVEVEPISAQSFRVRLSPSDSIPNRDFVIAFRAARAGVRPEVFFERKLDKPGTFLLVVTPPAPRPPDAATMFEGGTEGHVVRCGNCGGVLKSLGELRDVPGIGAAWTCAFCGAVVAASADRKASRVGQPRDVVFLIDRSASMRGGSVPQERRAVRLILEHLGPTDAVQLFAFDHDRLAADEHGDEYMPMSSATIERIDSFLSGIAARGGSELEEAIERAAKLPIRDGRTKLVVLMTDAAVGNDGRLLRRAREILSETRLFVLGIGPAVNRYLVERLARACGGASDVLLPTEDVETVVPKFARRVRHGGPVLKELKLAWDDALPVDVYPSPIPDLFGGQPVQLLGRFNGSGKTRLILTGTTAAGDPFRQEVDVELPEEANQVPGLERLWAKLRIDSRIDRLAREPSEAAEIRMEVLGLALKHALLSPYTSLVAEDSEKRVTEPARRVEVATEAVAGSALDEDMELSAEEGGIDVDALRSSALMEEEMPRAVAYSALMGDDFADEEPEPEMMSLGTRTRAGVIPASASAMRAYSPPRPAPAAPPAPASMGPSPDYLDEKRFSPPPAYASPAGFGPPPPAFGAPPSELGPPPADFGPPPVPAAPPPPPPARPAAAMPARELSKPKAPAPAFGEAPPPPPMAPKGLSPPAKKKGAPPQSAYQSPPLRAAGTEDYPREVIDWALQKGIGELDLVFLVDETGSMGAYIDEVKRRLLEIIEALKAAPLCRSLRMGLVGYRDHPPQDYTFASRAVPLTDDIEAIRRGVMEMAAQGGGDGPESVTDGLFDVVRLNWRLRAARVVVWVGDAPPHGVEPRGDEFPGGCPCGHHWFTQAESCREMGIAIHAVGCLPALTQYYVGAEEVFRTVARTTRGLYLPLYQAHTLIPLITGVAETELDKQRIEERIAEVIAAHERALAEAEEEERVRFITDVLRQENLRPRSLVYDMASRDAPPPLKFRDITANDVEESIDRLRREGRTTI